MMENSSCQPMARSPKFDWRSVKRSGSFSTSSDEALNSADLEYRREFDRSRNVENTLDWVETDACST